MAKKRVAVLISGNGSNLQALMDAAAAPDYPAEIVLVVSNKADAYGVTRAKNANIPALVISHKNYASREMFDAAMQAELVKHKVDIVCLAGFMRLLSAGFVKQWQGRMLNIHPSLLPDFKGAHAVRDALAAGAKESGCTVHLVTEELDAGPIIAQARVNILPGDTEETLHERIHAEEHRLYPEALKMLAEKR
jgi:phosphoribosylglycinamide formyltransferase 1